MVYRELDQKRKNFVFSAGSLGFGSSLIVDEDLQTVVKNVLDEAGVAAVPVVTRSPSAPRARGTSGPRRGSRWRR
jgi:hypothetical protein